MMVQLMAPEGLELGSPAELKISLLYMKMSQMELATRSHKYPYNPPQMDFKKLSLQKVVAQIVFTTLTVSQSVFSRLGQRKGGKKTPPFTQALHQVRGGGVQHHAGRGQV